jgi:hypothetical protein
MYGDFMNETFSHKGSFGQILPSFSGNPGGRPKDEFKVAELARSYTGEAVETLVDPMRHSKDDRVRGTASQALLDRGWGKAKVEVATSGGETYIEALQAAAEVGNGKSP